MADDELTVNDVIDRLYGVVSDNELSTLDNLMIRADLLWRCPNCGAMVPAGRECCP